MTALQCVFKLDDVPDEDEYDTEDSFIDDRELDEYFEVDNAKTKHDGFFVNRGKLESMFFRVVHAPKFLSSFASDRRHMRDSAGNWIEDPPPYDPFVAQDGIVHNLNEYIEIKGEGVVKNLQVGLLDSVYTQKLGLVVSKNQLEELFSLLG